MRRALKRLITGQSFSQEYLCLKNELREPLAAYLVSKDGAKPINIAAKHQFVGYKPLLIAIVFEQGSDPGTEVCICLTDKKFEANSLWRGFHVDDRSVAKLLLTKKEAKRMGESTVVFYEGLYGRHHFVPRYNQIINSLLLKFKRRAVGNVSLDGNLYDQVRIAYAIPRKISMITVAENELMNMFPTDLHGGIDKDHYISSLRIGGEACEQIERIGRIIVSDIDSVFYQSAYDLGKNHMQSMKPLTKFDLSNEYSEVFKFPLPTGVGSYKELEVMETFDIGIHRLFIYNVLRERTVKPISPLFHIHSYYAQWRKNNKLPTDYLFRNGNA